MFEHRRLLMHLTLPFLATGKNSKIFTVLKVLYNGSLLKHSIFPVDSFLNFVLSFEKTHLRNTL